MAKGFSLGKHTFDNDTPAQTRIYYVKRTFMDRFNLSDICNAGFLILKGNDPCSQAA